MTRHRVLSLLDPGLPPAELHRGVYTLLSQLGQPAYDVVFEKLAKGEPPVPDYLLAPICQRFPVQAWTHNPVARASAMCRANMRGGWFRLLTVWAEQTLVLTPDPAELLDLGCCEQTHPALPVWSRWEAVPLIAFVPTGMSAWNKLLFVHDVARQRGVNPLPPFMPEELRLASD